MGQTRNLCPDVVIYVEVLDSFKSTIGVAIGDGPNALALDAYDSFFLSLYCFYFLQLAISKSWKCIKFVSDTQ